MRHGPEKLAQLLAATFTRSPAILNEIKGGHVFDYEAVQGVEVHCAADKASVIQEREWFPGQTIKPLANGRLELAWPNVPREPFVHWILSYAGYLEVVAPEELRAEVLACGTRIAAVHQRKRPSGS